MKSCMQHYAESLHLCRAIWQVVSYPDPLGGLKGGLGSRLYGRKVVGRWWEGGGKVAGRWVCICLSSL